MAFLKIVPSLAAKSPYLHRVINSQIGLFEFLDPQRTGGSRASMHCALKILNIPEHANRPRFFRGEGGRSVVDIQSLSDVWVKIKIACLLCHMINL